MGGFLGQPPTGERLRALLEAQHGVVARRQLRALGLGEDAIDVRCRTGSLVRVARGVYAAGHGRLTDRGRWQAAVLSCGEGAVLSHRAAAVLWGIWQQPPAVVDVTVPRVGRVSRPGIALHRSGRLGDGQVARRDGIRVTNPARTLVDIAEGVERRVLERALDEAQRLRLCSERRLRAGVERGGRRARPRGRLGRGLRGRAARPRAPRASDRRADRADRRPARHRHQQRFLPARPDPGRAGVPVQPRNTGTGGPDPVGSRGLAIGRPSSAGTHATPTTISSPLTQEGPVSTDVLSVDAAHEAYVLDVSRVEFSFVEPGQDPVGGPLTVRAFDEGGAPLGSTVVDAEEIGRFLGVVAPEGSEIGRINVSEPGGSELIHSVVAYDADGGQDTGNGPAAADAVGDLLRSLGLG